MVACAPILQEKIRAEVWLGNLLLSKTPFILNFQVNKARTQVANTASITMDILAGMSFSLGQKVIIRAGTKGNLKSVFSGIIRQTRSEPSFGRPSYFRLTLSCEGVTTELQNKRFTRRLRTDGQGLYCMITSGPQNRPEAGYSLDYRRNTGTVERISSTVDPSKNVYSGGGEHTPLVTNPSTSLQSTTGGLATFLATPMGGGRLASDEGLGVHDHSEMTEGGPAWGVYSAE